MARTREFDPDDALDAAMHLFWRTGYRGTSMDDLVRETGVNRHSLYALFGSKEGLFDAALAHFEVSVVAPQLAEIAAPGATLSALERYFDHVSGQFQTPEGRQGCLVAMTANELAYGERDIAETVQALLAARQKLFRDLISNAQSAGEVRNDLDADQFAGLILATLLGLAGRVRADTSAEELTSALGALLALLRS